MNPTAFLTLRDGTSKSQFFNTPTGTHFQPGPTPPQFKGFVLLGVELWERGKGQVMLSLPIFYSFFQLAGKMVAWGWGGSVCLHWSSSLQCIRAVSGMTFGRDADGPFKGSQSGWSVVAIERLAVGCLPTCFSITHSKTS